MDIIRNKSHLLFKHCPWLKCSIGFLAILLSQQAHSEIVNVGYDGFNNPTLNVIDAVDGSTPFASLITDWQLLYDDIDGTGTLTINATQNDLGIIEINNGSVTTNNIGSLHVNGTIDFIGLSTSGNFFGDMVITVDYDDNNQVTIFNFDPIANSGISYDGFLMTSGPLAGQLLDFHVTSSLLAIVDNPFPNYSRVPVPAAAWLFGSGLMGLIGIARRKAHF